METSKRVKATCYFFRFECRVRTGKKCIFNCFSRASFGFLDVRLIFKCITIRMPLNYKQVGEASLSFDPWLVDQIVECRRVLKWTYAYGFYLPENEHAKRAFFEYLQG